MLEDYYKNILNTITHSSITIYSEVIETTLKFIQYEINDAQKFYVLFIVSAGDPKDIQEIELLSEEIKNLPLCIVIIQVFYELIQYKNQEKLEKLNDSLGRKVFKICKFDDISDCLEFIELQMIDYALNKNFEPCTRIDKRRISRVSSLKLSPEKIKPRNNYFTKSKADYIELLKQNNALATEIEEVSLLGVPFILKEQNIKVCVPQRKRKKTIKQLTIKSLEIFCRNCKNLVNQLEESECGCKSFCNSCVSTIECPNCTQILA